MPINMPARQKFSDNQKGQQFMDGVFKATASAMELKKENSDLMEKVNEGNQNSISALNVIARNLVAIYKIIPKSISLPKIFPITGRVEVSNLKNVEDRLQSIEE